MKCNSSFLLPPHARRPHCLGGNKKAGKARLFKPEICGVFFKLNKLVVFIFER